ncbi:hypothetical protein FW320_06675 [Azospirillum sp. Vi22]|uniref:hypothetical protein n=1 Tax=Azospirillum baldaniorum TaxID=1064539 RepID=UPI00157AE8C6|nr:hypothetical protein [Azospirillum baldaniorum]NUB05860.1 hypothetical protein [Azospirillum baldaniorum]
MTVRSPIRVAAANRTWIARNAVHRPVIEMALPAVMLFAATKTIAADLRAPKTRRSFFAGLLPTLEAAVAEPFTSLPLNVQRAASCVTAWAAGTAFEAAPPAAPATLIYRAAVRWTDALLLTDFLTLRAGSAFHGAVVFIMEDVERCAADPKAPEDAEILEQAKPLANAFDRRLRAVGLFSTAPDLTPAFHEVDQLTASGIGEIQVPVKEGGAAA